MNDIIVRRGIAAVIDDKQINKIVDLMGSEFSCQISCFQTSVVIFGVWLIGYLLWWIFNDFNKAI